MLSVCVSLFTLSYVWTNWLQCDIVARQSDNAMSACCNVILEELKTATQCLGIKPKAIK